MSARSDSLVYPAVAAPPTITPLMIQQVFSFDAPLVIFFVRHPDKDGTGVSNTPPEINDAIKSIEAHFAAPIEANSLLETSSVGTYIALQFGKAIDIYPPSFAACLHIYLVSIEAKDSKPKKIASIAKEWRDEISKNGDENHAIVLLYHNALLEVKDIDSVLAQAAKQNFFPKKFGAPKSPIEDAAILAHQYVEEINKTKVGKACFIYHPSDVMQRIADSVKLAYADRAVRLKVMRHQVSMTRNSPGWSIQEFWRRGYDVAIHHLRFGCLQEAMASFMQLFTEFFNKSDDFGFVKDPDALVRLGSLRDLFDPRRGGQHSRSMSMMGAQPSYPHMLADSAEIVDSLLFIVGCEMYCCLLLYNKPAALVQFNTFLEVANEKLSAASGAAIPAAVVQFFLYRACMSALSLCCSSVAFSDQSPKRTQSMCRQPSELLSPGSVSHQHHRHASTMSACSTDGEHTTLCETLIGVEGSLLAGADGLQHLHQGGVFSRKDLEMFQISLGNLCLVARDHFVSLGAKARGLHLPTRSPAEPISNGSLIHSEAPATGHIRHQRHDSAVSASITAALIKTFPHIEELKNQETFEASYLTLSRLAGAAFSCGKRSRHECSLLCEQAQILTKTSPAQAAEIVRLRILPHFSQAGWSFLHGYVRKLYIDCFEAITKGQAVPPGVSETYEGCLERMFELLKGLPDKQERQFYWEKLLALETSLEALDHFSELPEESFALSALCSKPKLSLRRTLPSSADPSSSAAPSTPPQRPTIPGSIPSGPHGNFSVLTAHIDEPVFLCVLFVCPVDLRTAGPARFKVVVILESKKKWKVADEPTHLLTIDTYVSSEYNEADMLAEVVMPLVPCHAGEYRIRSLSISIGVIQLKASWADQPRPFVLVVPEPDIGIQFTVSPLSDYHCFGDTREFCTADVVIKKPLFVTEKSEAAMPQGCSFEEQDTNEMSVNGMEGIMSVSPSARPFLTLNISNDGQASDALGSTTAAISVVYNKLSLQDERDFALVGRILVGKPTAHGGPGEQQRRGNSSHQPPSTMVTPMRASQNPAFFGDLRGDANNGSFTSMAAAVATEPLSQSVPRRRDSDTAEAAKLITFHSADTDGEKTTVPLVLTRLNTLPNAKSDHDVALAVEGNTLVSGVTSFSLRLGDASVASKTALLRSTKIKLQIPLLPIFMQDEKTHFSFCCKRDRDVCVQNTKSSMKFSTAFHSSFSFKSFQGRVHCLVMLQNILSHSVLCLHAIRLNIIDEDQTYMITRSSVANKRCLFRPFAPKEKIALCFELTPSPSFHSTREVVMHHVQINVAYGKWDAELALQHPANSFFDSYRDTKSPSLHGSRHHASNNHHFNSLLTFPSIDIGDSTADANAAPNDSRSTTPETGTVTPNHYQSDRSPLFAHSVLSMSKKVSVAEAAIPPEEWRNIEQSLNIYYGPVGSFESRHHCLFNIILLLGDGGQVGDARYPAADDNASISSPLSPTAPCMPVGGAPSTSGPQWGLEGRVFACGEPIVFDVVIEPQAHNWPDDEANEPASSASGDQFFVQLVVDPTQWMVLGKSVVLRTLSKWDDHRCRFSATPIRKPVAGAAAGSPLHGSFAVHDVSDLHVTTVTTPTVVLYRACVTSSSVTRGDPVAVDVVACRAHLRIRME